MLTYLLLFTVSFFIQQAVSANTNSEITFINTESSEIIDAFKSGSSAAIAKYFNTNVSISINNMDNLYSKQQAEVLLKDFYTKNPFKQFNVLHQGQSKDGAQYLMGSIITSNGTFRVYTYYKKINDQIVIKEMRIE